MLVTLLAAGALLLQPAGAQKVVSSDDFTGTDGSPPDVLKWTVNNEHSNDYVRLESNTVRTHIIDSGLSYIEMANPIDTDSFTINIDWQPRLMHGRPANMRLYSESSGSPIWWMTVIYDADYWGFGVERLYGGSTQSTFSQTCNAIQDTWYTWEIDVFSSYVNVTCRERTSGTVMYTKLQLAIDPFPGKAVAQFGVYAGINWHDPQANYDNYEFTDHNVPAHLPPAWEPLPSFQAVEDVPLIFNFVYNVSDPDSPSHDLYITSESPYVPSVNRLVATFRFPGGVTEAQVLLTLNDGHRKTDAIVNFTIQPVNDPPSHDLPEDLMAVEDVPLLLDLSDNVWDEDSDIADVFVKVDDPYATLDGLNLTVTFPEDVLEYDLWFNLSDGLLDREVHIHFTVKPVNDPPTISLLDEVTAIEDTDTLFNISSYISDADTPREELQVMSRSPNCTVEGHVLTFHYLVGGVVDTVMIEVSDGRSKTGATLQVRVEPRNDAPVVNTISPRGFVEDEEKMIDLSMYIEDEDTPREEMTMSSEDPAVVRIEGFSITLLFTSWLSEHEVVFSVSDGYLSTEGSFLIQVQEKNDPPVIVGIGALLPPVEIVVDEGTETFLLVVVEDDDDTNFKYTIKSFWGHVQAFTNGTLRIFPSKGEVGDHSVTLTVEDNDGGMDTLEFTIKVMNVDDPPSDLLILNPNNHTVVEEGVLVNFSISVLDPDTKLGQVLTITWTSNLSGLLASRTTDEVLGFSTDALDRGKHRITVTVTDGTHLLEGWFDITVVKKVSQSNGGGGSFLSSAGGIAVIVIIIILVVLVVISLILPKLKERGKDKASEAGWVEDQEGDVVGVALPAPVASSGQTSIEVTDAHGLGLSSLIPAHVSYSKDPAPEIVYSAPDYTQSPEATTAPSTPPPPVEPPSPLSEEEIAERAHSAEVRDVMRMLTQLPRGLPTELWNMDMSQLARDIVDGPKRTAPDGTPLVKIKRTWYSADLVSVGNFLREYHDEEPEAPAAPAKDKAEKLEQLESRLLEGKISEETYERLRKKFEGE